MMNQEKSEQNPHVGALEKRRAATADGTRYLIYYTFENLRKNSDAAEKILAREVKNDE